MSQQGISLHLAKADASSKLAPLDGLASGGIHRPCGTHLHTEHALFAFSVFVPYHLPCSVLLKAVTMPTASQVRRVELGTCWGCDTCSRSKEQKCVWVARWADQMSVA